MPRRRHGWYSTRVTRLAAALGLLLVLACSGDGPTAVDAGLDDNGSEVTLALGTVLDIRLGTVGPAAYADTPGISGAALTFQGVEIVPPYLPSGPTKRYRFRAVARGTATLAIARIGRDGVVHADAYVLNVVVE